MTKELFFQKRSHSGFTLIEILIYIGISSVIIIALSVFLIWLVHSVNKAKTMRETLYSVRRAMEVMTYEIREAKSISPLSTATHLSLEKSDNSYIDFYLDSSILYQKNGAENPIAITSDKVEVKELEFKQIATVAAVPSVQISLTIEYKNPSGRPEYQSSISATSTASLRNH